VESKGKHKEKKGFKERKDFTKGGGRKGLRSCA
jgi:hypothetical protein